MANRRPLPQLLRRYRAAIIAYLQSKLAGERGLLWQMLRYHLGFSEISGQAATGSPEGKLLRPALLLFSCEAAGGRWQQAIPAAGALELIHDFSLVHDDIQDQDLQRRHRPALWSLWGVGQAINAGDALGALAGLALGDLSDRGVTAKSIVRLQQMLSAATLKMIEGQVRDLSSEEYLEVRPTEYLSLIALKTGALIRAACEMGALLGGADQERLRAFAACGQQLGLAFQVRDDLLGIWGKKEETGKPEASDLTRRKPTLPIIYALERAMGKERESLLAFYRQPACAQGPTVAQVIRMLDRLEVKREAEALMRSASSGALQELVGAGAAEASISSLRELLDFLFGRFQL